MEAFAMPNDQSIPDRRVVMMLCAEATRPELERALKQVRYNGEAQDVRRPETGLVMARGRIGGEGRPFNFGEATVTRATVRIASGQMGFSYHLGRDAERARAAAILDALWQSPDLSPEVERALAPVRARIETEQASERQRAEATRVNFFTMVRGED